MPTGAVPAIPRIKFVDSAGNPVAGGSLTVYLAGTTTKANSWQDKAMTVLNENPMTLDGNGEALVWLDASAQYKLLLKDSLNSTLPGWPVDNVTPVLSSVDLSDATGAALIGTAYGTLAADLAAARPVARGGTGATTAADALTNIGAAPLASPTFTGDPKVPTAASGDNGSSAASTAFVQATTIGGVGQSWQNVLASRALTTTYTNSTGRAIAVYAGGTNTVGASTSAIVLTVGGVVADALTIIATGGIGSQDIGVRGVVPPGATYAVTATQLALTRWSELR